MANFGEFAGQGDDLRKRQRQARQEAQDNAAEVARLNPLRQKELEDIVKEFLARMKRAGRPGKEFVGWDAIFRVWHWRSEWTFQGGWIVQTDGVWWGEYRQRNRTDDPNYQVRGEFGSKFMPNPSLYTRELGRLPDDVYEGLKASLRRHLAIILEQNGVPLD